MCSAQVQTLFAVDRIYAEPVATEVDSLSNMSETAALGRAYHSVVEPLLDVCEMLSWLTSTAKQMK